MLDLYFNEGLDVEQIAERMRISVKTVYTKKHKIEVSPRSSTLRAPARRLMVGQASLAAGLDSERLQARAGREASRSNARL